MESEDTHDKTSKGVCVFSILAHDVSEAPCLFYPSNHLKKQAIRLIMNYLTALNILLLKDQSQTLVFHSTLRGYICHHLCNMHSCID